MPGRSSSGSAPPSGRSRPPPCPRREAGVSQDPTGFGAGDANLYRFVGNSPTNGSDPTGLVSFGFTFFGYGYDVGETLTDYLVGVKNVGLAEIEGAYDVAVDSFETVADVGRLGAQAARNLTGKTGEVKYKSQLIKGLLDAEDNSRSVKQRDAEVAKYKLSIAQSAANLGLEPLANATADFIKTNDAIPLAKAVGRVEGAAGIGAFSSSLTGTLPVGKIPGSRSGVGKCPTPTKNPKSPLQTQAEGYGAAAERGANPVPPASERTPLPSAPSKYSATLGKATSSDYKANFFKANPDLEGKVVVHHAVEQQVMTRYPGVMTEAELHSLENLRGIPKSINSDVHLSKIRKAWNEFYRANPTATKEQLLQKATEIDKQFGTQFTPPVGG